MDTKRMAQMADRIAKPDSEGAAMVNVDEAIDNIIAALIVLDENLPLVETDNIPQKAALDTTQELLDTAIKPYMADIVKAMDLF